MDRNDSCPACHAVTCTRGDSEKTSTYRVPYLQLDLLAINVDHACAKLHANGEVVYWLKALVGKLQ